MLDITDHKGKKDIKSLTFEDLEAELSSLGEKPCWSKQAYD
mgnify:CR=1 FL=1